MAETRKAILARVRERDDAVVAMICAANRQWWRGIRNGRYKRECQRLIALSMTDLDALPPPTKRERERERMMGLGAYHL